MWVRVFTRSRNSARVLWLPRPPSNPFAPTSQASSALALLCGHYYSTRFPPSAQRRRPCSLSQLAPSPLTALELGRPPSPSGHLPDGGLPASEGFKVWSGQRVRIELRGNRGSRVLRRGHGLPACRNPHECWVPAGGLVNSWTDRRHPRMGPAILRVLCQMCRMRRNHCPER